MIREKCVEDCVQHGIKKLIVTSYLTVLFYYSNWVSISQFVSQLFACNSELWTFVSLYNCELIEQFMCWNSDLLLFEYIYHNLYLFMVLISIME